jgi:hypothetical protein
MAINGHNTALAAEKQWHKAQSSNQRPKETIEHLQRDGPAIPVKDLSPRDFWAQDHDSIHSDSRCCESDEEQT